MSLRAFYTKLSQNGIDESTPFHLKNKLHIFNVANVLIFCINFFYSLVGLSRGYYAATAITALCLVANTISYVMVKKGNHLFAFHFTIGYAFVFLSAFSFLFGGASNSYYYFLFIPVACNVLFDSRIPTLSYLVATIVLMMLNVYWVRHVEAHYPYDEWMEFFGYPNTAFVALLIFSGVRLFKLKNQEYSRTIDTQRKSLQEKNKEVTDSINYAQRIQSALIPAGEEFSAQFRDSFVFFRPKDIVSGDFYWIAEKNGQVFYATGDCTGHGVPGGFMTMLGISFLDEIVNQKQITEPAQILNNLRERLIMALRQTGVSGEARDGMDVTICRVDKTKRKVTYAGANNHLYVIGSTGCTEHRADKQPCGYHHQMLPFTQHELELKEGEALYTFTDGMADQFGGPKGKKYKYRQLLEKLSANHHLPMAEQRGMLERSFLEWKGQLEQIDDVCVIGVKF